MVTAKWETPRAQGTSLRPFDVHIWRLDLDAADPGDLRGILSEDERERAQCFHWRTDQDRFVVAHAALREILALYLRRAPEKLVLRSNEGGKPMLDDATLAFNLSHSHDMALVAISHAGPVGIDVERVREDLDFVGIAASHFSQEERLAFAGSPTRDTVHRFFCCWARKEAYLKARGEGLTRPLSSFSVSTSETPELISDSADETAPSRWRIDDIHISSAYAAALAVDSEANVAAQFAWRHELVRTAVS